MRVTTHPGEMLREEFLIPYGLSANRLAIALGWPANRITGILNGTRSVTGETAVILGHAFRTGPEFWLNLQTNYDLSLAAQSVGKAAIQRADRFAGELVVA